MKSFDYGSIGDCFYTYDEKIISSKIETLRKCFPNFELNYSMKTNPNINIAKFILNCGLGIDVASKEEVLRANNIGFPKNKIWFSAPGKTLDDIRVTFDKCTIVADSINELILINDFCKTGKIKRNVGIRINPSMNSDNLEIGERMCGASSQFGIDEEILFQHIGEIKSLSNINISGIHIYVGSQILNYEIINDNFSKTFQIADTLINEYNMNINFINFGGGFGVPYTKEDSTLDFESLHNSIKELVLKYRDRIGENVKYIIESGRYIITEAGKYYCRISDIKESRGTKYLIVRGGINAFFRPVYKKINYIINTSSSTDKYEAYTIAGNSCTPEDIFIRNIELKKCNVGDYICIFNAGSYGYTMSLLEFISLEKPKEVYINDKGQFLISGGIL